MNGWSAPAKRKRDSSLGAEWLSSSAEFHKRLVQTDGFVKNVKRLDNDTVAVDIETLSICIGAREYAVPQSQSVTIILKREFSPETRAWFNVGGARKLLKQGVCVHASGTMEIARENMANLCTSSLKITKCLPECAYIFNCIKLVGRNEPVPFFDGNTKIEEVASLAAAMGVTTRNLNIVTEALNGCPNDFFKCRELQRVCKFMRANHGWYKSGVKLRPPKKAAVEALRRLEDCGPVASWKPFPFRYGEVTIPSFCDPLLNIPNPEDRKRQHYIVTKKVPQIKTMVSLAHAVVELRTRKEHPIGIVDVGGGRGDLAIALAASFGKRAFVTVLDVNKKSLLAGKARAGSAGLKNVRFEECSIEDAPKRVDAVDLVVGLHCCGGLAEAAAAFAVAKRASFTICCCCFCSNHNLACLTKMALDDLSASGNSNNVRDIGFLQQLAQRENCKEQFRAQQTLSKIRLHYCQKLLSTRHPGWQLLTSLEQLPEGCSSQVCIMLGISEEKKQADSTIT